MFCDRCGARFEDGALVCLSCGSERRGSPDVREPRAQPLLVQQEVREGPQCPEHPGMPLLGACPRCGRQVCVRCAPDAVNDVLTCTRCFGLTEKHQRAPGGATCAKHTDVAADFICARCGTFACGACRATGYGQDGLCVRCEVTVGALASRGSRFAANFIDNVVVLLPMFIGAALSGVLTARHQELRELAVAGMGAGALAGAVIQVAAQVAWAQSVGKKLLAIQVVKLDGSPVELWRLLVLRNLVVYGFSQLCGFFALIDALAIFGSEQRCLHDYIASTTVVDKK